MSYWSHRPIDNDEDVDDFDEFDPTPYGGGYDIHLTYGRPIEPSEETCYQISSGGDDSVDYDRPNYSSHSEPSAYADEVIDNEYSSYSRPKPGRGRPPAASGGPGPAYGFQPGMNRPGYGREESEFEEPPPPFRSEYGRRPEYEAPPPPVPEFEEGYGRRPGFGGEEEELPRRFGRPGYGGGEEEEPPRRFGRPGYGEGQEEEQEPPRRFGRPAYGEGEEEEPPRRFGRPAYGEGEEEERPRHGRRNDDEEEERPKYGRRNEEDEERPKYGRHNEEDEEPPISAMMIVRKRSVLSMAVKKNMGERNMVMMILMKMRRSTTTTGTTTTTARAMMTSKTALPTCLCVLSPLPQPTK